MCSIDMSLRCLEFTFQTRHSLLSRGLNNTSYFWKILETLKSRLVRYKQTNMQGNNKIIKSTTSQT